MIIVATLFPWLACVLGKSGAKVKRIRLGLEWPPHILPFLAPK